MLHKKKRERDPGQMMMREKNTKIQVFSVCEQMEKKSVGMQT
jgi:hypothetical protein